MTIAREESGCAGFELAYRYGSFPRKECFPLLEEAVARVRMLAATHAHSFMISQDGKIVMSGMDILWPAQK